LIAVNHLTGGGLPRRSRRGQFPNQPCGHAADEHIAGNVFGHHSAARHDARLPNSDAGQYGASRRNPRAIFDENGTRNIDAGPKIRRTDFVVGGNKDTVVTDTDAIANPYFSRKIQE
jgi:hypothetical protein